MVVIGREKAARGLETRDSEAFVSESLGLATPLKRCRQKDNP